MQPAIKRLTQERRFQGHRVDIPHDLSQPIRVVTPDLKPDTMREADDSFNSYLLGQRESAGKRTVLRITVEAYARKSTKGLVFSRLRNKALLVSLPSAAQAELVIDMLMRVCAGLDGKLLAKAPEE